MKKPDNGVRPLGILGVVTRLAGVISAARSRPEVKKMLHPHDLGTLVSGGVEAATHITRTYTNKHPDHVVLKLDITNAFNAVVRKYLFVVMSELPACHGYFRTIYLREGIIVFRMVGRC